MSEPKDLDYLEEIFDDKRIEYVPKIEDAVKKSQESSEIIAVFLEKYFEDLKCSFGNLNDPKRFSEENLNKHVARNILEILGWRYALRKCDESTVEQWKEAISKRGVSEGIINDAFEKGGRYGRSFVAYC